MHLRVTLRLVPHQRRERLSEAGLCQEADRLMDELTYAERIDVVEDASVESDADTGFLGITAIVVAEDEQAAIDTFTTHFWQVATSGSAASADDPIDYVILEKRTDEVRTAS